MKIKFLRAVQAVQNYQHRTCYDEFCWCGGYEVRAGLAYFSENEEVDPNEIDREITLTNLKYNTDYIITEYP